MFRSWVEGAAGSGYDADHLPLGVFSPAAGGPRVGVRIGEHALDLAAALPDLAGVFGVPSLNAFLATGRPAWSQVRRRVTALLTDPEQRPLTEPHLHRLAEIELHLPIEVADYVDFYASLPHATNVGRIFRPDGEPLKPNWHHLPVAYHGRAGTVVPSGTPVRRPHGQSLARGQQQPAFGPSRRLDIEAEVGFVVGSPSTRGVSIPVGAFADHVFGVALLNDWSARDIQSWEYEPLGPFLGKSFATSLACWVTPLEALAAAQVPLPEQRPEPLPYLRGRDVCGYDLDLEVELNGEVISRPPYRTTYWSPAQMLAHLTANGASLRTGDLFASGTVSGPAREQRGSLLELSWGGAEPFTVAGEERTFLQDGDTVTIRATAPGVGGARISLGEVSGTIAPAVTPA